MTIPSKSRWANEEEDEEEKARRKLEKERKRRLKLEKQQRQDELQHRNQQEAGKIESTSDISHGHHGLEINEQDGRPIKRQKVSDHSTDSPSTVSPRQLLRPEAGSWGPCRRVDAFEPLNHIEEGSYGWVSRARELATGSIVALKKLKMEGSMSTEGFPVTGLREIQCLMSARGHRHIVDLREVVVGRRLEDVYLVMEFVEHDLKTLHDEMREPWLMSEVKTLLLQLCGAVGFLHDHWILHRDLKTSNILMNNRGEIKLADFGMARYFGDPSPKLTQLVVTLWYRAPELLLGTEEYGEAIDIWSIGCIFGELVTKEPLLQGMNEVGQLAKTFELCGIPTDDSWPEFRRLPNARSLRLPRSAKNTGATIRARFPLLTTSGVKLLTSLLSLDPSQRPSAHEVMKDAFFSDDPRPKSTAMFPTFPSKANQERVRRRASPSAPKRGDAPRLNGEMDFSSIFAASESEEAGAGFQLKLL